MTPEERFERIEKTLDRMAADHEKRFAKIDRTCEFLANQQAQSTSDIAEMRKHWKTIEARIEKSNRRIDAKFEQISSKFDQIGVFLASIGIVSNTALKAIENHMQNGHGPKSKRPRRKK